MVVDLSQSGDQRRNGRVGPVLVELDDLLRSFGDTGTVQAKLVVYLGRRGRGTERGQAERLMCEVAPTVGGVGLDGHDGVAGGQDGELVGVVLDLEDFDTGDGDDSDLEALVLEDLDGVETQADFGTGGDEGNVGFTLDVFQDVTTSCGLFDGRVGELGQVLSREAQGGRGVLGLQADEVGGGSLVTVSGSPDLHVGQGSEPCDGFDRLVGRSVFTETDRIVGSNVQHSEVRKGGQSDGTGGVGNKVQERGGEGDDTTVRAHTVGDGDHGVFTNTESNVSTGPFTQTGRGRLEINGILPSGQVGTGQIGGTTDEFGQDGGDLGDDVLGELSGTDGGILGRVGRQDLFPTFGQSTFHSSGNLSSLLRVLFLVRRKSLVPCLFRGGTSFGDLGVDLFSLFGNEELVLGVESKLLLHLHDIVGLQGRTVNVSGTLFLGTETDNRSHSDQRRLLVVLLALLDGGGDTGQIGVAVIDVQYFPSVRLESLLDVFGERAVGVTVNGDVVVIVDGNQVPELQVTGEGSGFRSDTFLQASVTGEHVGVVVEDFKAVLVEDTAHVSLSHGQTDGVGETLTEGTGGNLDSLGNTDFRVTRGDRVQLPELLQVIHGDLVAQKVQHGVLQRTGVTVGQDESVTVVPFGVFRVGLHESGPQDVGGRGHAHGCTGVTRVGLGDDIGGKGTDSAEGKVSARVDGFRRATRRTSRNRYSLDTLFVDGFNVEGRHFGFEVRREDAAVGIKGQPSSQGCVFSGITAEYGKRGEKGGLRE